MAFFGSFFSSEHTSSGSIEILSVIDFMLAVTNENKQLVDIRTPREYEDEHIRGAVNIDFFQPFLFKRMFNKLDKKIPVYIYCRTGNRSQKAGKQLAQIGFTKIYDLDGGITALK